MSSVDAIRAALAPHAAALHAIARDAIRCGFDRDAPARRRARGHDAEALRGKLASFVTLRRDGVLRGCAGSAYAVRPLADDVSQNAYIAAFRDKRFAALARAEFAATVIEISVLGPPERVAFVDEADLASRLVPGRDGLILEHEDARGLFLPQVWQTLPDPRSFLDHLKDKAGLWPAPLDPAVRALRFEAVTFAERPATTAT